MKNILLLGFLTLSLSGYSQTLHKNRFGLSAGIGAPVIAQRQLDGGPSYEMGRGFDFGVNYYRAITPKTNLESGVFLHANELKVTPAFYPGWEMAPQYYDIRLLYVPLFLKVNLAKYFYLNGGLLADVDLSKNKYISSQTGLGTGLGLGTDIHVSDRFAFTINPYLNLHGLWTIEQEHYPERIFDAGIKAGIILK
ncbi:hypothetical protein PK28_12870 [Hymenobacter sp. DG25B]|uniref:hypothetical protein n=1 Tax=Hymenobacter sp. DG25B TaxID=1385664 RepID=UPI00054127AC|nr:hypothetical protein [Hymenobacter sp. DG25B]AIZ64353.1 hypothetical protein PK28_12870 [Hymenobacter sp. DG25B]